MLPGFQSLFRILVAVSVRRSHRERKNGLAVLSVGLALLACVATDYSGAQASVHFAGIQSVIGSGLSECFGVAVDASGNVYIADTYNNRVLMETPSAGGYTQSVVAIGLNLPYGVAVDSNGNVYVADTYNFQV